MNRNKLIYIQVQEIKKKNYEMIYSLYYKNIIKLTFNTIIQFQSPSNYPIRNDHYSSCQFKKMTTITIKKVQCIY